MRCSRYTVVADGDAGEKLLYNTATGAFAALDEAAFAQFEAGGGALADELALAGFVTERTPEEELAAQQAAFDAMRADRSTLTLSIVPTYACNYRCPYCYELGHNKIKGKMDARMQDVIFDFVNRKHAEDGFEQLAVQWYGGDPSLALDVVEALSKRLIAWCDERGVAYDALMLTNANIIDEAAAQMIADVKVRLVALTIDGPEELHNRRRVAADGSNSYARNINAARLLRENGVHVAATMNVDKVSWPLYPEMRERLAAEEGIELGAGKLCDYGGCFGRAPFCEPDFDLFTHEEFARARLAQYAREGHGASELRNLLRPVERFCTGQLDNYFVIDLLGDVYNCDGWVGDRAHVRFNLLDDPSSWKLADISHDPTRDAQCSACELLPVCLGNCHWERACNGWPCHPFRYTLDGYLCLYRAAFDQPTHGYTLLSM
ncbi:MAG: radical SAM protein [Eggerthellaceae bacterium]|nr:radical SAM protein [Eggerthellaceae bacterium]